MRSNGQQGAAASGGGGSGSSKLVSELLRHDTIQGSWGTDLGQAVGWKAGPGVAGLPLAAGDLAAWLHYRLQAEAYRCGVGQHCSTAGKQGSNHASGALCMHGPPGTPSPCCSSQKQPTMAAELPGAAFLQRRLARAQAVPPAERSP